MGGGKLNKAFTLIELLAIIVILAIIAVITIPIILNVVDNAKRGSVIDSAYGYKDAIHKFYVQELYEDQSFKLDGTYMVSNLKGMGLTVDGTEPTDDSWVVINNDEVYDFSLKFDDYVANYDVSNQKIEVIKNGTIELTPEAQAEQDRIDNVKRIVSAYIEEAINKNSSLSSETVKSVSEMTDVVIENGPVDGWVHFIVTDGEVVINDYSLKVDNYIADYSSTEADNMVITKDGTLRDRPIVRTVVSTIDSVGYYNTEWIGINPVYYNPVTGESCTNYSESNSNVGVKTGCLKWYAYSENADGTVNMLLDHNTSVNVAWTSQADYEQTASKTATPSQVGIVYYSDEVAMTGDGELPAGTWSSNGTNNRGPITLLKQLQKDTKDWVALDTLTEDDTYTAEWEACSSCGSYYNGLQKYTINYNGYKARLISAEEINKITGKGEVTTSTIKYGSFDSNYTVGKGTNKYGWLFDHTGNGSNSSCESSGCNSGLNSDPMYWTSSPSTNGYEDAWFVFYNGNLYTYDVNGTSNVGVRPVITVSKSDIFGS